METIFEEVTRGKDNYWYNYAIYNGRLIVDGFYFSEQEALQFGSKNIPVGYKTVNIATRDRSKATQIIKRRVWEETNDIDMALRRAKHERKGGG